MSSNLGRRWWPLAAGVLAGIVVAMAVSLLGSTSRKAEAKVLITSPAGTTTVRPLLGNLRELATSGVVAGNVKSTLRLPESAESLRRHLDASVRPGSEVIAITATDASADRARQLAQEAAVVFGQLVEARFGTSTPELHSAGLDSAHVRGARPSLPAERADRRAGRAPARRGLDVRARERHPAGRCLGR